MAEANFSEFVAGRDSARFSGFGRMVNVAGAVCTLALLVGIAVWGYRLAVRDANGVPVIQAMDGPMRIAPEDPGGQVAAHTGLSVNRIAAEGTAGDVPDRIVLAEAPVELAPDDGPGIGTAAPLPVTEADTLARTLALAEEIARQVASETEGAPSDTPSGPAETDTAALEPLPDGAVRESPRPMPRPDVPGDSAAAPVLSGTTTLAAMAPDTTELAPETLQPGTRLAQIGAFDDPEAARREWDRVANQHAPLFVGKARVIQPATSVGRTFYRLRVHGFDSEDDSRRFCAAVESGDLRCIPVTTR